MATYIVLCEKIGMESLDDTKSTTTDIPLCQTTHNTFPLFFVFSNCLNYARRAQLKLQQAQVELADQLHARKRTMTRCAKR
jgi:hypothetical protein